MIQNYNRWRVLQIFFDDPDGGFTLRGISKAINLAPKSVKQYIDSLSKEKLVIKTEGVSYPAYKATKNEKFRFYKKMDTIFRLEESGLLDFLSEKCSDMLILFGSASRGEDTKGSDIDIFVLSQEKEFNLKKHETILKREISLHFSQDFSKLPNELKNNILNGIILRGYVKVY